MGHRRSREKVLVAMALILLGACISSLLTFPSEAYVNQSADDDPLYFPSQYTPTLPVRIQSNADWHLYSFLGEGTAENPYLIEGYHISSTEECLIIENVEDYVIIRNCLFESTGNLISVVRLDSIDNVTLEESTVIGGREGVLVSRCDSILIEDNIISDSIVGLHLISSNSCTVERNSLFGHSSGLEVSSSDRSIFSGNKLYRNSLRGMYVDYNSDFNTFTLNSFGWNGPGTVPINAIDNGDNNTWTTNGWTDYAAPGPYNVTGLNNHQDLDAFLLIDNEAPTTNVPEDIIMGEGSEVSVNWTAIDAFPFMFILQIGAEVQSEGLWTERSYSIDLQTFEPGDYTLILVLIDGSGNRTEDVVTASVLFVILGDIGTELVTLASIFTIVLFIVLVCIFKLQR